MNDVIGAYCILQALLYFVCAQGFQAYAKTYSNYNRRTNPQKWLQDKLLE